MTKWREVDKANPPDGHVWVFDRYYLGVTVGYWNGYAMCTLMYRDDAGISHWMPMEAPAPPLELDDEEDDEEEL